jgi:hypothetical protein
MAGNLLSECARYTHVEAIVVSATLVGSLGTAWVIQRALLGLCLKALRVERPHRTE